MIEWIDRKRRRRWKWLPKILKRCSRPARNNKLKQLTHQRRRIIGQQQQHYYYYYYFKLMIIILHTHSHTLHTLHTQTDTPPPPILFSNIWSVWIFLHFPLFSIQFVFDPFSSFPAFFFLSSALHNSNLPRNSNASLWLVHLWPRPTPTPSLSLSLRANRNYNLKLPPEHTQHFRT